MKKIHVRVDSRSRISLTKVSKNLPSSFYAYESNGKIILEPLAEIPMEEVWIFEPKNKHILEEVKEGLAQKGTIKRSFAKTSKK